MSELRVGVILPAAGRSTRFGLGDKVAMDVGGRPMLLRSVEIFARRPEVAAIGEAFDSITVCSWGESRWTVSRSRSDWASAGPRSSP